MLKKLAALYALVIAAPPAPWRRHPARPAWLRPAVGLLAFYLVSPIDLIPDVLPVIGLIDDLVLIPLLMAWLVRMLPDALKRGYADAARTIDAVPVRTR